MAKLTWEIETTSGTVTESGPTISDVQMDRFLDYIWVKFPQWDFTDPDNPVLKPRNAANEAQAYRDWVAKQWDTTRRLVVDWERRIASDAARSAVADITV